MKFPLKMIFDKSMDGTIIDANGEMPWKNSEWQIILHRANCFDGMLDMFKYTLMWLREGQHPVDLSNRIKLIIEDAEKQS